MPAWVIPAIAAGASLISQGIARGKDSRQLRQQEKLNQLEMRGNKEMMSYGMGLQKDMWEATGYGAQRRQLEEAGMNTALMYGMGGGGGQTVGSPGTQGVAGGMAPVGSGQEMETGAAMGLQMQSMMELQKAQKENIEADTTNKKADALLKGVEAEGGQYDNIIKDLMTNRDKNGNLIEGEANDMQRAAIQEKLQTLEKTIAETTNLGADSKNKIANIAQGWKELDIKGKMQRLQEVLGKEGLENKDQDQMIHIMDSILELIPTKVLKK